MLFLPRVIAAYGLDVAIRRRSGEKVLAGPGDAIARFVAELQPPNRNLPRLPVTIPPHCHYLAAAADSFRDILQASAIAAPRVTVLGAVDAAPVRTRQQAIAGRRGRWQQPSGGTGAWVHWQNSASMW